MQGRGRFQDRVAFITGGTSGIGQAAAIRFAREGASVAIVGRDQTRLEQTARAVEAEGGQALTLRADITREPDVREAVAATLSRFGRLDIAVPNAGILGPLVQITEIDVDDWDELMAVNIRGYFLTAKHVIPPMKAQGGGVIVVVASDSSFVAAPGQAAYCTTKGATLMFTKALSVDLAPDNIRVNCVCPSIVDTPMLEGLVGPAEMDALAAVNLGRHSADQVAGHILFLASDESASINGTSLVADFGALARSNFPV